MPSSVRVPHAFGHAGHENARAIAPPFAHLPPKETGHARPIAWSGHTRDNRPDGDRNSVGCYAGIRSGNSVLHRAHRPNVAHQAGLKDRDALPRSSAQTNVAMTDSIYQKKAQSALTGREHCFSLYIYSGT